MPANSAFQFPEIGDDDVLWASDVLDLPKSAFVGWDGNDPRKSVLKSRSSLDIAACPGSGKTTVLIAKLAILAQNWHYRNKGVCVLSHTNVARTEIERRLGNTSAGQRLLSYPHFIGTIHKFVDEFLALPWLRSLGYPIKMVDTNVCEDRRWKKISWPAKNYLEKKKVRPQDMRITDTAFNVEKKKGAFPCGAHTETYKAVQQACEEAAREGYHCYDDMFVWARDLLSRSSRVANAIRDRFPVLFLDEAQDNSEEQSSLLNELFVREQAPVIRQRFGDSNQAIYSFTGQEGATTFEFPDVSIKTVFPNSFRFGQAIADLADPLGIVPYSMVGQGPKMKALASGSSEGKHTIFLFDESSTCKVLDAYASLLLETFSDQELRVGTFTAVGMVHKQEDGESTASVRLRVGDYWPAYDPEIARLEPTPRTLVQYVRAGVAKSIEEGEAYCAVEKIAEGILRLASMAKKWKEHVGRRHKHRFILESLQSAPEQRGLYSQFLGEVTVRQGDLSRDLWENRWKDSIHSIANNISGEELTGAEVDEFLSWGQAPPNTTGGTKAGRQQGNVYCYVQGNREAKIKVGSIHSVKGQTHTATLILETAWYGRNLAQLMPWLSGEAQGGSNKDGVRQIVRLRTHYVAMTRPSHLLCLALQVGSLNQSEMDSLKQRGWNLITLHPTELKAI